MRHVLRVASALLQRLAHLREALGDVAGDAGGLLRRIEGMRLLPDALQKRADVVLAQIVQVDAKAVAVGEMAVGAPGAGEVGVKLQAVADIADDDEGRRRMIRIEQEDVRLRLLSKRKSYVFLLDADHPAPPFIIVCDVGHCLELYADFTGTGRAYGHFPDRNRFRIYMDDLRKDDVRAHLKRIWQEPHSLDPSKEAARVTRDIAKRLAQVSKGLEERGCTAEDVAHFLMRCIFTMFAEDAELLPKGAFTQLLKECIDHPDAFAPLIEELWLKMDEPQHERRFYSLFKTHLRHFNGSLFKQARAFPLGREEIGELLAAADYSWTEVDPAIFGTLLEQALDKAERRKLGAHYTPRAYVQRLVEATVMEPLREDWQNALRKAEHAKETGDEQAAIATVRAFHRQLCATRVLTLPAAPATFSTSRSS